MKGVVLVLKMYHSAGVGLRVDDIRKWTKEFEPEL